MIGSMLERCFFLRTSDPFGKCGSRLNFGDFPAGAMGGGDQKAWIPFASLLTSKDVLAIEGKWISLINRKVTRQETRPQPKIAFWNCCILWKCSASVLSWDAILHSSEFSSVLLWDTQQFEQMDSLLAMAQKCLSDCCSFLMPRIGVQMVKWKMNRSWHCPANALVPFLEKAVCHNSQSLWPPVSHICDTRTSSGSAVLQRENMSSETDWIVYKEMPRI